MIDWEYSAWCPSYWEYCEAARLVHGDHWFEKLASEFLEPYWPELLWHDRVVRSVKGYSLKLWLEDRPYHGMKI